jgi:hypothetical protein
MCMWRNWYQRTPSVCLCLTGLSICFHTTLQASMESSSFVHVHLLHSASRWPEPCMYAVYDRISDEFPAIIALYMYGYGQPYLTLIWYTTHCLPVHAHENLHLHQPPTPRCPQLYAHANCMHTHYNYEKTHTNLTPQVSAHTDTCKPYAHSTNIHIHDTLLALTHINICTYTHQLPPAARIHTNIQTAFAHSTHVHIHIQNSGVRVQTAFTQHKCARTHTKLKCPRTNCIYSVQMCTCTYKPQVSVYKLHLHSTHVHIHTSLRCPRTNCIYTVMCTCTHKFHPPCVACC